MEEGIWDGWEREREGEQGGKLSGVQMETGECDRAFFHECLLKALKREGP